MYKITKTSLIPLLTILFTVFFFFFRLFYPNLSLFIFPSLDSNGIWQTDLYNKYFLSTTLKEGQWPLWNPYIGNGFPTLSEGQIGTFYLPNLLLFRFLPFPYAYNINLALAFFLSCLGIFLFLKRLNFSMISATFGALVFTFSGYFSTHLAYLNLIQATSLLPLIFYSFYLFYRKSKLSFSILIAFLLSQQILTGHFYTVFITLIGVAIFWVILFSTSKKYNDLTFAAKRGGILLFTLFLTLLLSSIQLLPTIELLMASGRINGLDFDTVTSYPYPLKHLMSFINPYFFGNPAIGTYPSLSSNWGFFGENTAYIGILPLFLALASLLYFREKIVKIGLFMLIISLLLVLGKNSPLYFIFSFPIFNFFTVPPKFLLLTLFSLTLLSAYMFEKVIRKINTIRCIFIGTLFLLVLLDEYFFSYKYPPVISLQEFLRPAETADFLKTKDKVTSIGTASFWNSAYLKMGWLDLTPYIYFRNSLYPNFNLLFKISQVDINLQGLIPKRLSYFNTLTKSIEFDEKKGTASMSALSKNALSLATTTYIISPYKINDSTFDEVQKINAPSYLKLNDFYIYQNKKARQRSYITSHTYLTTTIEDVYRVLGDEHFLDDAKVLIEDSKYAINKIQDTKAIASIVDSTLTEVIINTQSRENGILVLTDTNYPGWKVFIDKNPGEIISVNLSQKGVLIPKGDHTVKFTFQSLSFAIGKIITIFAWIIAFLGVFLSHVSFLRTTSGNKTISPDL